MVDYLQPRPILLIIKAKNVQVTGINAVKLQNKLEPILPLLELKSKRFDHPSRGLKRTRFKQNAI